ncbi:MAG: nuclear transport factor 2 family protein [Acidobacteria bacterium]|nr:nuclear transport factor 2 family protein [Acidobacteriota bacterium]
MRPAYFVSTAILVASLAAGSPALAGDANAVAAVKEVFETGVAALNEGNLDGFLDTVHDEALSFYACGPTSGKQGREACALDWRLFFNSTTNARFETRNEEYRIIGDTGIAYGEYSLSVNYDGQGRQTVHEGRYTMTYTRVGDEWRIAMQHNTPVGDSPQPVRELARGAR